MVNKTRLDYAVSTMGILLTYVFIWRGKQYKKIIIFNEDIDLKLYFTFLFIS
jgi:hypothetical protein